VGLPTTPLTPRYIHLVRGSRNGWHVSGSIAGGTECPRNLARISFLNSGSDTILEVGLKPNSIPQNWLVR